MLFGSIMLSGMHMVAQCGESTRNTTIASLSLAMGLGFTQTPALFKSFPEIIRNIFADNCVAVTFLAALLLNIFIPQKE